MAVNLGKQVGPLPLGAWLGMGGAALALGYWVNKKNRADETVQPALLAEPGVGTGGAQFIYDPPTAIPQPEEADETNHTWGMKAVRWLIAQGHSPSISQNAITKALNSLDLTVQENALWELVLKQFGPPPEPLAPVAVPETPPVEQPPVVTPPTQIPAPSNLRITGTTPSVIVLAWDRVSGALSYRVTMWGVSGHHHMSTSNTLNTSFTQTGLASSYQYKFTVYAITLQGQGPGSDVIGSTRPSAVSSPKPSAPAPPQRRVHIVAPGDVLTGIALRYLGRASRWMEIYNLNRDVIENVARSRGKGSSRGGPRNEVGWWIFAGTNLVIP